MLDYANSELPAPKRVPWNKGKLTGAKPPLRQKHVWAIRTKLQIDKRTRDLALFNLAIDSKLRGCDVVALKVEDVAPNGYCADRATVRQRKTKRPVRFELTEQTRQAVDDYIKTTGKKSGEFLFTACRKQELRMTTRQYARLLSEWIASIGLDPHLFGTHSLRRTKATLIYRRTGNLRAVQLLLGHTKIESTVRRQYGGLTDQAFEYANVWPAHRAHQNPTDKTASFRPALQSVLLVAAFLARVFHARLALRRGNAVWCAALAAFGLDPGLALLDGNGLLLHGLPDQPFGLLAHCLFRHFNPVWLFAGAYLAESTAPANELSQRFGIMVRQMNQAAGPKAAMGGRHEH